MSYLYLRACWFLLVGTTIAGCDRGVPSRCVLSDDDKEAVLTQITQENLAITGRVGMNRVDRMEQLEAWASGLPDPCLRAEYLKWITHYLTSARSDEEESSRFRRSLDHIKNLPVLPAAEAQP